MSPTPTDPNQAQAWISGEAPDQTIDFYIPRGNTGPMGPQGPQGPSLAVGSVETIMGPAAPGTVGPQGLTGPKGDPGGFTSGTPLGSNNLNAVIADGIYVQQDGSLPSLALNYPSTLAGAMYVHKRTPSSIFQTYHARAYVSPTDMTTIVYSRWSNDTGGTWSPWRSMAPIRVDQTAGRVIYQYDPLNLREQLVWGDTGNRIITDLITPGNWNVGVTAKLRRVGSHVELRLLGLAPASGLSGSLEIIKQLPSGFHNQHSMPFPVMDNTNNVAAANLSFGGGPLTLATVAGRSYGFCVGWQTLNSWPSVLPGTADGSISNT